MSAPGAINLEHTTVKFDNEIKKARHSITTHSGLKVCGRHICGVHAKWTYELKLRGLLLHLYRLRHNFYSTIKKIV